MKDEIAALPLTLLGSWYVIITLGGSTRTAAIWGTVIALAIHLAIATITKDPE
jgi:hypothetical protein